ncbi:MAG: DUF4249 domain-containing protein [Paludibacter sp.]|nr:DUF4249 domain-containing protein [Paludibacter sp.]
MKSLLKYISISISIILLASCEKIIEFNGEITEPQVVMNSFITPDSVIKAHISESKFFLSSGYTFKDVENADVSVLVNHIFKEKMMYTANGIYRSNFKPGVGDTIRLEVKIPSKNDVSSETIIEPKSNMLTLDTAKVFTGKYPLTHYNNITQKEDTIGYNSIYEYHFKLKFKDDEATKNFYRLTVRTKSSLPGGQVSNEYFFTFDDLVSGNNSNSTVGPPTSLNSNQFNVFSDEMFNGKEYPLTFYVTNNTTELLPEYEYMNIYYKNIQKEIYVDLQTISKSYYLYLKSRDASSSSNGVFSEPIQIHNNIVGGIGILGSYTSNVFEKMDL